MPDFKMQPSFPIASVIDAAGRNAQLQQQAREAGNKSLIEGLQSIGQVGQSIFEQKQRVAQSLALKKALLPEVPDETARTMSPDQLLHAATILHKTADVDQLMEAIRRRILPQNPAASTTPQPAAPATPAGTTPQPGASLPGTPTNVPMASSPKPEATLASTSPTIPMPAHTEPMANMPFGGGSSTTTVPAAQPVPVPIAAPPSKPLRMNPATIALGKSMGLFTTDIPVMSNSEGLARGSAPKGTHFINTTNSSDQTSWATATPQEKRQAQGVYEGRIRLSDIGYRDKSKVSLLANEYAIENGLPPFKSYNADVNATMAKYATSGKLGQNALSLNTALGHAASAYDSYQAIGNTNQEWLNVPINKLKQKTNDPNVVALGINLNALQGELANVFKNTGATDQEISHWQKYLNEDLTPSQFNGALAKIDELLKSRLSAMEYQRSQAGGGGSSLISPHAKQISDKLSNPQASKNASVTPNGTKYTVNP